MNMPFIGHNVLSRRKVESLKLPARKAVLGHLDLILLELLATESMGIFDLAASLHKKHGVLLSIGTIYPHVYKLMARGYVRYREVLTGRRRRKRVFELADNGRQGIKELVEELRLVEIILRRVNNDLEAQGFAATMDAPHQPHPHSS